MTGKKDASREGLRNLVSWGLQRSSLMLTVGTTVVPNLAKRGREAGKSNPLSQIVAPPMMDPRLGLTSVRVGAGSPSVLGQGKSGLGLGPAFRGG